MAGKDGEGEEDDDYMGDLSLFLPPEATATATATAASSSSASSGKKSNVMAAAPAPPKQKKPKNLNWQERRKLEKERKQREEDERTLAGLEAAIPASNVGFRMLQQMGYNPGSALGKDGTGRTEPVGLDIRRSRAGLGTKEAAARRERVAVEGKRRREEELMEEFGTRQRSQWRSRRVVWDYRKAEAALAQLENREVVESAKEDEEEKEKGEEEEEEVITEEDLHEILMTLRDQHRYCLYCGCQYGSVEALQSECPGLYEDDH